MSYYLALIGTQDNPIYEADFGTYKQGGDGSLKFTPEMRELNPFIVHSSLDIVEDLQWLKNLMYLKVVDNFYGYYVSAYVSPSNVRFLLLHELRNEESIKQFFFELNDLYVKTLLNPFYSVNQVIRSTAFDAKVKALVKKYL